MVKLPYLQSDKAHPIRVKNIPHEILSDFSDDMGVKKIQDSTLSLLGTTLSSADNLYKE